MNALWLLVGGGVLAVLAGLGYVLYRRLDREQVSKLGGTVGGRATASGARTIDALTSYRAKAMYFLAFVFLCTLGVLWVSWNYAGPVSTIVYLFLFLLMAGMLPGVIGIFGNAMPGSSMLGKLHLILGAFAFGRMVLVQFEDRFDLCPATESTVYIDGQWHDIKGGKTNWSILGWRPFGMLRFKDEQTLRDARVDTKAARDRAAAADGGAISRGGYAEADAPFETGIDGKWVIDLKRVFSRGIKKIGDISLIETAEEITSREHAQQGIVSGLESLLAPVVGLILGLATGYVLLGGV